MWWFVPAAGAAWLLSASQDAAPARPMIALWKPGLWALSASTTTFVGLAAMQGLHDRLTDGSYSRTLAERKRQYVMYRTTSPSLVTHGGLSLTVVGLNLAAYSYCRQRPGNILQLADGHNSEHWTLLTAAFCHMDSAHLCTNMATLIPEIPHALEACGQSPYQFVAFYVSAAIFSSYAQRCVAYSRWSQSWISRFDFTAPLGVGASGVARAVFAASCFTQSWSSPSFIFSALTLSRQVMGDIEGLLRSRESIGFAAHLAGAAFGVAYAYFDANYYLWKKLVRFFRGLDGKRDRPRRPNQTEEHGDLSLDELVRRLNSSN
ncbi:hypothetical protein BU23DRAFT_569511 [Bimuria novae-zelandiae CBS 107.79]|uniref:Peptidase S54 rhomboid domain-containing protein n=1 Tax=Bimuria novae-zelandiae CBS 107.79 TaxID=1447943 RepID=A0A6A5VFJ0_9PLEO|nr:hypothetical protein BU23DRAFT_569511 [Bimuria novae-zelandiae CBS 107.79]